MKNKLKLKIITALSFVFILTLSFGFLTYNVSAQTEVKFSSEINSEYCLGESVIVPNASVTIDGKAVDLEHVLEYPDGRKSNAVVSVLNVVGDYSIKYYLNDVKYSEKTFSVVRGTKETLFTNIVGASFESNVDVGDWADFNFNGVNVTSKGSYSKFRYNGVIDLNKPDFIPLIDLFVNSEAGQQMDSIEITLTDVIEKENYIAIIISSGYQYGSKNSQVKTSACGIYEEKGLQWMKKDGKPVVSVSGTTVLSTFGHSGYSYPSSSIKIYYDVSENALYAAASNCNDYDYAYQKFDESGVQWKCVLKYDDTDMVGNGNAWKGFTTNHVYMDIKVNNWTFGGKTESSLLLMNLNGNDLSGVEKTIGESMFFVTDYQSYDNNLPKGRVGGEYSAFVSKAYDNYGIEITDLRTLVFDPDNQIVPVVNGKFKTDKSGVYTIQYFAKNDLIVNEKIVEITVDNDYVLPNIELGDDESVAFGKEVKIEQGREFGGSGNIEKTIKVFQGENEIQVIERAGELYFNPELPKDYVIKYYLNDFVGGQTVFEKNVNVFVSDEPTCVKPNVVLKNVVGKKVELPVVTSKIFVDGEWVYIPVKVYYDGVDVSLNMAYTPETVGNHTITYVSQNPKDNTKEVRYEFVVETIEERKSTYFLDDCFNFDSFVSSNSYGKEDITTSSYYIIADGSSKTANAQFIYPISDKALSVQFVVHENYHAFDNLYITFADRVNANNKIVLRLRSEKPYGEENESLIRFWVNNVEVGYIKGSFEEKNLNSFVFSFDRETNSILNNGERLAKVDVALNGEAFLGFESGQAIVSFGLDGIYGKSVINLEYISNQILSSKLLNDNVAPYVITRKNFAETNIAYVGDTFVINEVEAYDVLSPDISQILNITFKGKKIYSGNINGSYSITFEESGLYSMEFVVRDGSGNMKVQKFSVNVYNFEYALLQVNGTIGSVQKNVEFSLPNCDIIGDYTAFYICFVDENGVKTYASYNDNKKEYTHQLSKEGNYVVKFVVVSSCGLFTTVEQEVKVG